MVNASQVPETPTEVAQTPVVLLPCHQQGPQTEILNTFHVLQPGPQQGSKTEVAKATQVSRIQTEVF